MRILSAVLALMLLVVAAPSAAYAAGNGLAPVTQPGTQDIKPGQTVPLVVGVKNTDAAAVNGVVLNIKVDAGFDLPAEFSNCRYYKNGFLEGAWCAVDQSVPGGKTYALSNFKVVAAAHAQRLGAIVFQWYTAAWATSQGGIDALAKGNGESTKAGSGDALALAASNLAAPAKASPVGTVYFKLITSTATPRPSLTPRSKASSGAAASKPGGSALRFRGEDGGMSIGGMLALAAGIVVVLMALGAGGYFILRRRWSRPTDRS